ncbi:MAG: histidine phosphatase family protein [Candidatus Eremiobacteraeota bacterium]|nr:histidine phosphatase family protein [Candidatus Eremiobacteraeota bacterium]
MKIWFLRHGVAIDREVWDRDDSERPLTPDGISRMKREAKTMASLDVSPSVILTSPLVRAKQTADVVADRLKLKAVSDDRLGLDFDAEAIRAIAAERGGAASIMVVGHEPSMSETIGAITGGSHLDLKKGGLACVDFDDEKGTATLTLLLAPKVLLA